MSGFIPGGLSRWSLFVPLVAVALLACESSPPPVTVEDRLAFEPAALEFGEIFLAAGFVKTVEVENLGRATVTLRSVDVPDGFEVVPSSLSLAPGDREELRVRFRANREGVVDTALLFRTSAQRIFELPVRAQAVPTSLRTKPEVVDFGGVPVGESHTLPIELESLTDGNLDLHVSLQGVEFQTETGIIPLGGRQRIELDLTYTPQLAGVTAGWLVINPCQGCTPLRVDLMGQGLAPRLRGAPRELDFGSVHPSLEGRLQVTVRNDGDLVASVAAVRFEGEGAEAFRLVEPSPPFAIEPEESAVLQVAFQPSETGLHQADLRLLGEDGAAPLLGISVQGKGDGPLLQAQALDFGVLPAGEEATAPLEVRDLAASGLGRIVGATIEGADAAQFSLPAALPFPLEVGAEGLLIDVTYRGGAPGTSQQAELVLSHSSRFQPDLRIPLTGRAAEAGCELEFEPAELRFGLVGTQGRKRTVWLHHRGWGECLVWNLGVEGSGAFVVDHGLPSGLYHRLLPGEPVPIRVLSDRLTGDGWHRGALTVRHSTAEAPPVAVDLSAYRDASHTLFHDPEVVSFPPTPVGGISLQRVHFTSYSGTGLRAQLQYTEPDFASEPIEGNDEVWMGQTSQLRAAFLPQSAGARWGEIEVHVPGVEEPYRIPVEGEGTETCPEPCGFPELTCAGPAEVVQGEEFLVTPTITNGVEAGCTAEVLLAGRSRRMFLPNCEPVVISTIWDEGIATTRIVAKTRTGDAAAMCEVETDVLPPPPAP